MATAKNVRSLDKGNLLKPNPSIRRKLQQSTADDLDHNIEPIEENFHSFTDNFVIPMTTSTTLEDDSGDNSLASSSSTKKNPSPTRRRTLSSASKSNGRFSMHELRSNVGSRRMISPTRYSMILDSKGFDKEWDLDRERIGNAGKGFGTLMSDENGKESIAELIASVKDEDAIKIAQITQKHINQKHRNIHARESDVQKDFSRIDAPRDSGPEHSSESTLFNSRACKQYLENKYHAIFDIISKGVYNPLAVVKNRQVDASLYSIGSVSSDRLSDANYMLSFVGCRANGGGSIARRNATSIWHVTYMEIIKDFEQRNSIRNVIHDKEDYDEQSEYNSFRIESEHDAANERHRLSRVFVPASTQEKEDLGSSSSTKHRVKHSRALSLNNIVPSAKEVLHGKSRKNLLHILKRKNKKHNNQGHLSDTDFENKDSRSGTSKELTDNDQSKAQRNVTDSSSGDQSSRSSAEYARSWSEKDEETSHSSNVNNNGMKRDKDVSKRLDIPTDGTTDDSQVASTNLSGAYAGNYMDLESYKEIPMTDSMHSLISLTPTISITLHSEERHEQSYLDENEDLHSMNLSLSESSKIEGSIEYIGESEDEETGLVGETVLINIDILPPELRELISLYQEQGRVARSDDGSHYVELDIGLNDNFKFNRLIDHGSNNLFEFQVSLVGNSSRTHRSINQQEIDELITKCDEYIQGETKSLEIDKEILSKKQDTIKEDVYCSSPSLDNSTVQSTASTLLLYKLKTKIEEGTKSLDNTLVRMETALNTLESQHDSLKGEMKAMLEKINEMTFDVNNNCFHELKIFEDEIHILIAEREKSPWLDVFYLMIAYVLTGIMFMSWFIVACFRLIRRVLSLPSTMWKVVKH